MQLRVRRMSDTWYAVGDNDLCDAVIEVEPEEKAFWSDTASDFFMVSQWIETKVMEERSGSGS